MNRPSKLTHHVAAGGVRSMNRPSKLTHHMAAVWIVVNEPT